MDEARVERVDVWIGFDVGTANYRRRRQARLAEALPSAA
jgi:hypothetical protein